MKVSVHADTAEFKRLFGKSSQVERKLKTALRRNIRVVAGEAADDVKRRVTTRNGRTSAASPQQLGLRSRIAAGVQVKVMTGARAGVTIVASSSQMADGEQSLVRAWESSKGWRHPVFGMDTWTVQRGRPYFRTAVFNRQAKIRAAVEHAMKQAVESLGR